MPAYFARIPKIQYEGPDSKNPFAFRHYDHAATVGALTMREHLRFSVAAWHTYCGTGSDPFGAATVSRPWNNAATPIEAAEQRVDAAFEFFTRLGVSYYCFHDRDLAPEGSTPGETQRNLERICKRILTRQK